MKKGISIILAAAVAAALFAAPVGYAPAQAADSQWTASYWNNTKLKGKAVVTRQENAISYDWGTGSPARKVKKDGFSARWTRTVSFSEGTYVFSAGADDGIRVWVDGKKIINEWVVQYYTTYSAQVDLAAGDHTIKVEYYENDGAAAVSLTWSGNTSAPWTAQYFNGTNLSGKVIVTRQEDVLNHHWGNTRPAPGVRANNFSARWVSTQAFARGSYKFKVTAYGGFRLYVDNNLILDEWWYHSGQGVILKVKLTEGLHNIRLEYYNRSNPATIVLRINPWK